MEEPLHLDEAISRVPTEHCIVIDCLTLWTSNSLKHMTIADIESHAQDTSRLARQRVGHTIVVTNEVGLGITPENHLARTFVDLLGRVNSTWVALADRTILMIAGRTVEVVSRAPLRDLLDDIAP